MPDIIDTLVVALGLDASKFTMGAKTAQEELKKTSSAAVKHAGEIEAAGAKAAEFFTKLKNEALILAAVVTGGLGIAEFVGSTTKANIATGNLSKNLGISTQDLTAWERANVRAGGSVEGMDAALNAVNSSMQNYKLTGKIEGPLAYFSQLKIAALDSQGNLRDIQSVMLDLSNAMAQRSPTQRAELLRNMGLGDDVSNLLGAGRTAILSQLGAMAQLGSITDADYEASKRLNGAWRDLMDTSESMGRSILTKATPALETMLGVLKNVAQATKEAVSSPEPGAAPSKHVVRGVTNPPGFWDPKFNPVSRFFVEWNESSKNSSQRSKRNGLSPAATGAPIGVAMSVNDLLKTPNAIYEQRELDGLRRKLSSARSPAEAQGIRDAIRTIESDLKSPPKWWGAGIPVGARATASANGGGGGVTTNETNIGQITINTKATDANGIAREIPGAIGRNSSLVNQADRGVR